MVASTKGKKLSLLKGKKPRELDHGVIRDYEAVVAYAEARQARETAENALIIARRRRDPKVTTDELQAKLDEAEAECSRLEPAADEGEGIVTVRIRAMAPLAFRALKAEFPADEDDHQYYRELFQDEKAKAPWNESEFAPRLVAHSLIDPEVEVEDVREWQATWLSGEWTQLVSACMRANQETLDAAALLKAFGRTRS